jgi:hypothetical protein
MAITSILDPDCRIVGAPVGRNIAARAGELDAIAARSPRRGESRSPLPGGPDARGSVVHSGVAPSRLGQPAIATWVSGHIVVARLERSYRVRPAGGGRCGTRRRRSGAAMIADTWL